ncbi:MAG: vitamin B12-dependent ribonucleotide reductase [Chloroflexi bacterium]|nr:vitamin B12-dependent ribonucleotide reductase [Chloroflexota bacterium]
MTIDTSAKSKLLENIPPLEITDNSRKVLAKRYLRKDKDGQIIEQPEDMFRRVARSIAAAELTYNSNADVKSIENNFYEMMARLEFMPNSPTLMNAGRELGQLSACFVLPIEDSMESIFEAVKNTALIHKSGGGTGFSFSRLRPEKDRVGSTGGVASGPVSFMRAFDVATDVIKQGGTRRGANMAILRVDHPDIMKFIYAKADKSALNNFNLSVALTDKFMAAVENDEEYDLINPQDKQSTGKLSAKQVFNELVRLAHDGGDPGVVFIDRINQYNPTPNLGEIESTNPCGEQPLLPYESCNLGSINLSRMIKKDEQGFNEIDYNRLAITVKLAVRFLDNVIEVNKLPIQQIAERSRQTRKIGLGVMGFADMLMKMGIPYSSDEGLKTGEQVMQFINDTAREASVELAKERGVFPAYEGSIYEKQDLKVRNATVTTIAPTGTISIIAGCSGGIEPLFALSFRRQILDGTSMIESNPIFEATAKSLGFYSDKFMNELADGKHLADYKEVPDAVKQVFATAHDVSPDFHVRMQVAFQKYTDNAVSKTVNFENNATIKEVADVYMQAYKSGLKGITIYRDGSRDNQPMSTGKKEDGQEAAALENVRAVYEPRKRIKTTAGVTERITTGCGHLYITINSDEKGPCEVFGFLGKSGGCASAQLEGVCRLISIALRSGVKMESIIKQLKGIRCPSIAWDDGCSVLSCSDAIARAMEKHYGSVVTLQNGETAEQKPLKLSGNDLSLNTAGGLCRECGSVLVYQEGCFVCPSCAFTKCT